MNFNTFTFDLEYVDLDNLGFAESDSLEVEGPNGVGNSYVARLKVMENRWINSDLQDL